jgi:hypothetical protein
MASERIMKLIKNKRALSSVISEVIAIAAVIAIGFSVLAYVRSNSSIFSQNYGKQVSSAVSELQEGIAFEFVWYNESSTSLKLYILNDGTANNAIIKMVSKVP